MFWGVSSPKCPAETFPSPSLRVLCAAVVCKMLARFSHRTCARSLSTSSVSLDQMSQNPLALPRLPIPALDDTIERYLQSVRPLTTLDEYTNHESLVRDFQQSIGQSLQDKVCFSCFVQSNVRVCSSLLEMRRLRHPGCTHSVI